VLAAFEKVEAVRWLSYLKPEGTLVVNDFEIYSLPVLIGAAKYPDNVIDKLRSEVPKLKVIDAAGIAKKLGNIKAQNVVLLGALVKALGLEDLDWGSVIKDIVPPKLYELNIKAFEAGLKQ